MTAIDLLGILSEADRRDDGTLFQRLASALDLQILDDGNRVAVGKNIAACVSNDRLTAAGGYC